MTFPNITPDQLQAFLAQVQAQQTAQGTIAPPVQPAAPVAPPAPAVEVSVGDVLAGSSYGPGLFDANDPVGTAFTGTLATPVRAIQDRDFETKQPKFYPDGRPVPLLILNLDVPVSDRHPEGRATHYARGKDISAFNRAVADARVPKDVVEAGLEPGAAVTITFTELRKNPKFPHSNPAKIRTFTYQRPAGGTPQPPAPDVPVAATPAAPNAQHVPVQPTAPQAPVPAPAGGAPGLTPEQQTELLARLTGTQPPAA